jgi:hypothetical protein
LSFSVKTLNLNHSSQSNLLNFCSKTYNKGISFGKYISRPFLRNSKLISLNKLNEKLTQNPTNTHKITHVFKGVASMLGWGSWITRIVISGVNSMNLPTPTDYNDRIMEGTKYGFIGFTLSSLIGIKLNYHDYKSVKIISDKEGMDYQIAETVVNIYSAIGGIFFLLAKFAAEKTAEFGISILSLPFYGLSYCIDIAKNAVKANESRNFQKQVSEIIQNEDDLKNSYKLEKALSFLLDKITLSNKEITEITKQVKSDTTFKGKSELIAQEISKRCDNLQLTKYKRLERRIGCEAARDLRKNIKLAFNNLRSPIGSCKLASNLIGRVQKSTSKQIRNYVLIIIVEVIALSIFFTLTLFSGGAAVPILFFS